MLALRAAARRSASLASSAYAAALAPSAAATGRAGAGAAASSSGASALSRAAGQTRGFAAGGAGGHDAVTYDGVTLHKAAGWHKALGSGLAGLMWFWIFFRFYKDGDVLLYGHAPHFEHDDDHAGGGHGGGGGKGHHG